MSKITDLEAVAAYYSYDYNIDATISDDGTGGEPHRETIARVWDEWLDPDTEKYARLLAAAPDLLAACETVLGDWSGTGNATDPEAEGYETLQVVRAAIAKARGEVRG